MSMRAYVPLLIDELGEVVVVGALPRRVGFAVTESLRAADPSADEEDLEFEAMCQALDTAGDLGPGRRVVASADVPDAVGSGTGAVLRDELTVGLVDVVSFHVEESEGEIGAGYDDLLWYDVTELSELT